MKRILFRLGVAVLAFSIGIGAVWFYLRLNPGWRCWIENCRIKLNFCPPLKNVAPPTTVKQLSGKVEIGFLRMGEIKFPEERYNHQVLEFTVENGTSKPLGYIIEHSQWSGMFHVKSGKKVKDFYGCPVGSTKMTVAPGEGAVVKINASHFNGKKHKIGLRFQIGDESLYETFWSEEFSVKEKKFLIESKPISH